MSANSSIEFNFAAEEAKEEELAEGGESFREHFDGSVLEFQNPDPHELDRCKSVIDIQDRNLLLNSKNKHSNLKKALSYIDLDGVEVEMSLFQKIRLYDEKSVTQFKEKPIPNPLLSHKGKAELIRKDKQDTENYIH